MRHSVLLTVFILLIAFPAVSQDDSGEPKTLISGANVTGGGGGVTFKLAQIDDNVLTGFGGFGGMVINNRFTLGGGGFGYGDGDFELDGVEGDLSIGYGGAIFQYHPYPSSLVRPVFDVMVGGGGTTFEAEGSEFDSGFFVLEPGVGAMVHLTKFMRVSVHARYLYLAGAEIQDADLNGYTYGLSLMFGGF